MFTQAINSGIDVRFFLILSLTLLLPVGLAGTVQAQSGDPVPPKVDVEEDPQDTEKAAHAPWKVHFGEQAARVLEEGSESAQALMLQDIITVATQNQGSIDLSAAIPPLLRICERDLSETRRLMAVQALHKIGTEHARRSLYEAAMERLYDATKPGEEPSSRVRRAATAVLEDYYETPSESGETVSSLLFPLPRQSTGEETLIRSAEVPAFGRPLRIADTARGEASEDPRAVRPLPPVRIADYTPDASEADPVTPFDWGLPSALLSSSR